MIRGFHGKYRFLSNFWPVELRLEKAGLTFPSAEHMYQAAKCADPGDWVKFTTGSPGEAKRLGRQVTRRKDWEVVKEKVMRHVLRLKFAEGSDLALQLVATEPEELVEENTWGDTYWGTVNGKGANRLGNLLGERRLELIWKMGARPPEGGER